MKTTEQSAVANEAPWLPIASAPKDGTLIYLRSPKHGVVRALWHWDNCNERWATSIHGVLGLINACWDEHAQQPTEWQAMPTFN